MYVDATNGKQLEDSLLAAQLCGTKRNCPNNSPDTKGVLLSKKVEICEYSSKEFTSTSDVLQCDLCTSLVHAECEGVDKEHYQLLSQVTNKISNVIYYCRLNNCVTRLKKFIFRNVQSTLSPSENTNGGILQTLAEEQDVIRDVLSELSSKVDELCSLNQNLESEIKATANTVTSKPPSVVDSLLSTSPVEVVDEYLDRERRKCNLVIYNLPEPSASATKDRTQQDKNAFSQLVSSELKIDNVNLLKCVRLGKKPIDDKGRPLLISVAEASTK